MLWGVESHIVERFGQAGLPPEKITIELFEAYYGPTMNAVEAARNNGKADELHRQLVELANAHNQAHGSGTDIPATFLRVTVSV